jgi:uncharacterized Zn-finger protein
MISLDPGCGHLSMPFDQTASWGLSCDVVPQHSDLTVTGAIALPPDTYTLPETERSFREENIGVKKVFICTYHGCNKRISRSYDLQRHHDNVHLGLREHKCRIEGCKRAVDGFPRSDKRNDHERKAHGRQ